MSISYTNVKYAFLMTFFRENGFLNGSGLDVKPFFEPARYRKKEEYIPTREEVLAIINAAGSPKAKAIISCLFTSGFRNSTLIALRYKDVKFELDLPVIKLHCYPEMKKWIKDACKNSIEYYSFISPESVKLLKIYIAEMERRYGKFENDWPLFIDQKNRGRMANIKYQQVDWLVHEAARKA